MLLKVAARAHNAIVVTDSLGTTRPLKVLNYLSGGLRQTRLDAGAVADPQAGYTEGMQLTFPDNSIYLVSRTTDDYYKNDIIRTNIELVKSNNKVTVLRQVALTNSQGGVKGHVDTAVYSDLPCKIIPFSQTQDKTDDVLLSTYVVMIPSVCPVQINDRLQFLHTYNVAKVEGIKSVVGGLLELTFDRDLRW